MTEIIKSDKKKEYNKKYYDKKKKSQDINNKDQEIDSILLIAKNAQKTESKLKVETESLIDEEEEITMTFDEIQKYIDQQVQKNLYLYQQSVHPPIVQPQIQPQQQQPSMLSQVKTNVTGQITQALIMASIPILAKYTQKFFLEQPRQLSNPLQRPSQNTNNLDSVF